MAINDQNRVMFDSNRHIVPSLNGTYSLTAGAMSFERFVSANMLAGRIIKTDGTSIYGADAVAPAGGGQQNNNFSWPNVPAGVNQVVRVEELIFPQGDIDNYGLNVAIGPPPPPGQLMELPPIEARLAANSVVINDPANNDSVSTIAEVKVTATSYPYITVDGVSHPMPVVAHALYGFMNADGTFVATRLLAVFQESYSEESQKRRYKFLFKRTANDFDVHTRTFLGVVTTSLYAFVTGKGAKPQFPYSAQLIKLRKLQ